MPGVENGQADIVPESFPQENEGVRGEEAGEEACAEVWLGGSASFWARAEEREGVSLVLAP